MGLRPGAGRGDSVAALGSPVCAVGPGGCQAGKQERASPAPRSGTGRKGKGRGQEGQSGARGGVGGDRPGGESARLPPGRLCPSASLPAGWGAGQAAGTPRAAEPGPEQTALCRWGAQAGGQAAEPLSSGPAPAGRRRSVNPLSPAARGDRPAAAAGEGASPVRLVLCGAASFGGAAGFPAPLGRCGSEAAASSPAALPGVVGICQEHGGSQSWVRLDVLTQLPTHQGCGDITNHKGKDIKEQPTRTIKSIT